MASIVLYVQLYSTLLSIQYVAGRSFSKKRRQLRQNFGHLLCIIYRSGRKRSGWRRSSSPPSRMSPSLSWPTGSRYSCFIAILAFIGWAFFRFWDFSVFVVFPTWYRIAGDFLKSHFIFLLILMRIRTFSKTYFNQF